jgi:hypothetical protein
MNSKVLNPCEISNNTRKIKTKISPQNLIKSWDVTRNESSKLVSTIIFEGL